MSHIPNQSSNQQTRQMNRSSLYDLGWASAPRCDFCSDEMDGGGVGTEEVEAAAHLRLPLLFSCGGIVAALAALFPSSVFPILFLGLMSNCATLPLSLALPLCGAPLLAPSPSPAKAKAVSASSPGNGAAGGRWTDGRTDGETERRRGGTGTGVSIAQNGALAAGLVARGPVGQRRGTEDGRRTDGEEGKAFFPLLYALSVPLASF